MRCWRDVRCRARSGQWQLRESAAVLSSSGARGRGGGGGGGQGLVAPGWVHKSMLNAVVVLLLSQVAAPVVAVAAVAALCQQARRSSSAARETRMRCSTRARGRASPPSLRASAPAALSAPGARRRSASAPGARRRSSSRESTGCIYSTSSRHACASASRGTQSIRMRAPSGLPNTFNPARHTSSIR